MNQPSPDDLRAGARLARRERTLRRRDLMLAVATPLLLLAAWELSARAGLLDPKLFSEPSQVVVAARRLIASGVLGADLRASLLRIAGGYAAGATLGVATGLLLGYFRGARASLSPTFAALYSVPKIAILPLLLLVFGLGETTKLMIVAIPTFFVMEITTMDGVRGLDPRLLDAGRAYGATGPRLFLHVLLPGVLPAIFTGLRVAAGLAITVIIAAEFVAANEGLGFLIWNSWQLLQPENMYVGLITVALLGAGITGLVTLLERVALPWRRQGDFSTPDY